MVKEFLKALFAFCVPGGFILLAALGFLRPGGLPMAVQQPITALPYIVLTFGLTFGWYFRSPRMVVSLLILSLADQALRMYDPALGNDQNFLGHTLFLITAYLLPLNFLLCSIMRVGTSSAVRDTILVIVVLLQPFLVLWFWYPEQAYLTAMFTQPLIPWLSATLSPIPQAALAVFCLTGIMHLVRFALVRDPFDAGSAWALAAVFFAYHGTASGWRPANFFAAAGLILFVSLVHSTYQRTYRDDLTGIEGRVAYEEAIQQLGRQYAIAVLSIDQLRSYANIHGKSVAERVLKLVAPQVQKSCRNGRVFRVSGEEMTLLFHDQSALEALAALDVVRKSVEATSLYLQGRDHVWERTRTNRVPGNKDNALPVTVSIGLSDKSAEATSFDTVVKSAYRALYDAKAAGGNVVKRGTTPAGSFRRYAPVSDKFVAGNGY